MFFYMAWKSFSFLFFAQSLLRMRLHGKEKQCHVTFPPRWARLHQRWRAGRSTCRDKTICPPLLPSDMHAATLHCSPSQMHLTAGGIIRSTHVSQPALLPWPAGCALVTSHQSLLQHAARTTQPNMPSAESVLESSLGRRARRTWRWLWCFHG